MSQDEHLPAAAQPLHPQHDFTAIFASSLKAKWPAPPTTGSPNNLGTKNLISPHHCKPSKQMFLNTNLQLNTLVPLCLPVFCMCLL